MDKRAEVIKSVAGCKEEVFGRGLHIRFANIQISAEISRRLNIETAPGLAIGVQHLPPQLSLLPSPSSSCPASLFHL